jgi:hypothetical protein
LPFDNIILTNSTCFSDPKLNSGLNILSAIIGSLIGSPVEEIMSMALADRFRRFII